MNRDAIGGTITLITAVVTLVLIVAFFYACRSGGTDHLREEEYEDVGSAQPAPSVEYVTSVSPAATSESRPPIA